MKSCSSWRRAKAATRCLAGVTALATTLAAQSFYPHHNISFGVGGAQPKGDLGGVFQNRPGISIGYGYRFQRYFQADLGFDTVFGAGGVKAFEETPLGISRIRDYQFFIPFGGRAILPLAGGRFLISGGGGGAYLHYTELIHQPSSFVNVSCVTCSSRSGWGYYALAGVDAFLDRSQHFRLGVISKVYRGHTEGEPLAGLPGVRTKDRWVDIFGQVGFSF